MTENIKHNPPLICRDKLAVKLKEPVISNSHSCLDKVFYLNEFNTNYQCLLYGFFLPVVYILIDFLAGRISSSSSFHKKGTQVLDILLSPTQECVFVASVLSIWRNSCGVLSFQNIWTVCLLFSGFDSIALYKSEFNLFFFIYWDAGLIFPF